MLCGLIRCADILVCEFAGLSSPVFPSGERKAAWIRRQKGLRYTRKDFDLWQS